METLFSLHIEIEYEEQPKAWTRYGPYTTLQAASEIMLDFTKSILEADFLLRKGWTEVRVTLQEYAVTPNGWELLADKATEIYRNE